MSAAAVTRLDSMAENTSGTSILLRFALRRERAILPWWLGGIGLLLAWQSVSSQNFYDTPEKLAMLRRTMSGSAAAVAMGGPPRLLNTIGGEIVFEVFAYLAIVVALMNMFLVGRNTRTDEETGRAELIRSARVGRRAPTLSALALAAMADLAAAAVVFGAAVGTGLPVPGSLLLAAAVAGVGITFAAVTAVAAQAFENPRSVYGAVGSVLAAAYIARAVGDVGNGVLSWVSPIGWGQRAYPYTGDRWWPLVLFVAATAASTAAAAWLLERRDFGAGLFPYSTGRSQASRLFANPLGLAWRLQRGWLLGWSVGVFTMAAAYGSFADSIEQFLTDNPALAEFLPGNGSAADAVNSFLSLTLSMGALLTAAFGISSVLRARSEETAGRVELLLATRTRRSTWLASHLTVALAGSAAVTAANGLGVGIAYALTADEPGRIPGLSAAAFGYLPAVWLLIGVAAVAYGWYPRQARAAAWAYFTYCAVALIFTESFNLPAWFDAASPFTHTPLVPLRSPAAIPILVITAAAATGVLAALRGFRGRDVGH